MSSHGRESTSRRTSKTAYDSQRFERREKAKSSQSYAQYQSAYPQGVRRGSLRPANSAEPGTAASHGLGSVGVSGGDGDAGAACAGGAAAAAERTERPRLKTRTNSAPLVTDRGRLTGEQQHHRRDDESWHRPHARRPPPTAAPPPTDVAGQDEDETLGVVGAIRRFHPFRTPEVSRSQSHVRRVQVRGIEKLINPPSPRLSCRSHYQKSTSRSSAPKVLGKVPF